MGAPVSLIVRRRMLLAGFVQGWGQAMEPATSGFVPPFCPRAHCRFT
jgi:hypothetical protein